MSWVPDDFRTLLADSQLFDPRWYRLQARRVGHPVPRGQAPVDHFLSVGLVAGLDPGPRFSASRYLYCNPDVAASGLHPVVHYLVSGRDEGRSAHLVPATPPSAAAGRQGRWGRRERRWVLVVGHAAGAELFGAERSLLDILDAFRAVGIDTVVAVPATDNTSYLRELAARCRAVEQVSPASGVPLVDQYAELIDRHRVDAVQINTIVPLPALAAARSRGIPGVVNVREIPVDDPDLCRALGHPDPATGPAEVVRTVLAAADHLIAPSMTAAHHYPLPSGCTIAPCVVDPDQFAEAVAGRALRADGPLRVGLVGSLTAKKGISDLVELALRWSTLGEPALRSGVQFVAVGPLPEGDLSEHVEWVGYRPSPAAALAEVDVLLVLSHCIEAFGRTALEAAAAGVPVIAYRRGGPVEIVDDGVSGILVAPDDLDSVLAAIELLLAHPERRAAMGAAGRSIAGTRFSPAALAEALEVAYASILPSRAVVRARRSDVLVPLRTVNRTHHRSPFYVANRGRYAGATSAQFLDDHHVVAASLLGQRLHLLRLDPDRSSAAIVHEAPVFVAADEEGTIDLVAVDDASRGTSTPRVVTANCGAMSVSLYSVHGLHGSPGTSPELRFDCAVAVGGDDPGYVHGACFVAERPAVVAAAITTGRPRVGFATVDGSVPPDDLVIDGWIPKAVASFPGHVVVASGRFNVDRYSGQWNDARIDVVRLASDARGEQHPHDTHEILATVELVNSTADSCSVFVRSPRRIEILMADQLGDASVVVDVRIGRDGRARIRRRPAIIGSSFPHDVARSPDGRLIAFAEYGTDSVRLRRVRGTGRG